jgi:hypothetical protein
VDVAAAAVRVVGQAVVRAVPVAPAADLAAAVVATVVPAAARRAAIQFVRNAPIDRLPNECSQGERPA